MPEQTRYLFCQTRKSRVWVFQYRRVARGFGGRSLFDRPTGAIHNAAGAKIGLLYVHHEDQLALFPAAKDDTRGSDGFAIDVVAIYSTRYYGKNFDMDMERDKTADDITDVCAVLWVEWEDGVAYRVGSGEIEQKYWDELELEDISLVLG